MVLLSILCAFGMETLDTNLQKLVAFMNSMPVGMNWSTVGMAKTIGLALAFGVCSYECWMMILGRRGMDVMKLLRIWTIGFCIASSGTICSGLSYPGRTLQNSSESAAMATNQQVAAKEKLVAKLQQKYLDKLRAVQDSIYKAEQARKEAAVADADILEKVQVAFEGITSKLNDLAQRAALAAETKIIEIINTVIRFIGEVIFQMIFYGIILGQTIFMHLMQIFCPILFALSLAPPFKSAWSQWMGKYLSLSLWGFVCYYCLIYVDYIMLFNLEEDITVYNGLIAGAGNAGTGWGLVGSLGIQGVGTTCAYVVAMLVGSKILSMVPEVCSWLVPAGVSSGIGSTSSGMVMGAAGRAGGIAGSATVKTISASSSAAITPVRHVASKMR